MDQKLRPAKAAAPAVAPAAPAAGTANSAQSTRGNAAVQAGQLDPAAIADGATQSQELLRQQTVDADISVGGHMPAHLQLGQSPDGDTVSTGEATRFKVGVGRGGIHCTFYPPIQVRPGSFWARTATGGITISSLYYSFATGTAQVNVDTGMMGDVVDWFTDLKSGLATKFGGAIKGVLPASMQKPGFDPYTEPNLPAILGDIVQSLGSALPAGGQQAPSMLSKVTEPEISARIQPKKMSVPLGDDLLMEIGERGMMELTAHLQGNMQQAMSAPKLASIAIAADDVSIQAKKGGKIASIHVHSMRFGPDLAVQEFGYDMELESALNGLKALGILFELHTGQDIGIHDTNGVELQGFRARIDSEARTKLPDLLRDQVRQHDDAIPGFHLSSLFTGMGAPAPSPARAAGPKT